jgi:hypothetical protein
MHSRYLLYNHVHFVHSDIIHSQCCIHTQSYMALPKGGLVAEHVLILPIGHYAASTDTPQVSYNNFIVYKYCGGKTRLVYSL